jgi:hypothetical protein
MSSSHAAHSPPTAAAGLAAVAGLCAAWLELVAHVVAGLHDHDRRRRGTTGERDGECVGDGRRDRVALEAGLHPRHREEDRRHGCERELEAGFEYGRRHPRHQHERADGEEVPAIRRPRD